MGEALTTGDAAVPVLARWAPEFQGAIAGFSLLPGGGLVAEGRLGTEVQLYTSEKPAGDFVDAPRLARNLR